MDNNIEWQIYWNKFIYLYIYSVGAHLYCKRKSLVCDGLYCTVVDLARKCLTEYCESCKNWIRGREGGLLQLGVGCVHRVHIFMYLRAILCTFQISVDFYYAPVGGRGEVRGARERGIECILYGYS
jgi:hypothetical protein